MTKLKHRMLCWHKDGTELFMLLDAGDFWSIAFKNTTRSGEYICYRKEDANTNVRTGYWLPVKRIPPRNKSVESCLKEAWDRRPVR
jgi:hypothetical protein